MNKKLEVLAAVARALNAIPDDAATGITVLVAIHPAKGQDVAVRDAISGAIADEFDGIPVVPQHWDETHWLRLQPMPSQFNADLKTLDYVEVSVHN